MAFNAENRVADHVRGARAHFAPRGHAFGAQQTFGQPRSVYRDGELSGQSHQNIFVGFGELLRQKIERAFAMAHHAQNAGFQALRVNWNRHQSGGFGGRRFLENALPARIGARIAHANYRAVLRDPTGQPLAQTIFRGVQSGLFIQWASRSDEFEHFARLVHQKQRTIFGAQNFRGLIHHVVNQHIEVGGGVQIAANGHEGFFAQLVFGHRDDNGGAATERRQNLRVGFVEFVGVGRFDVDHADGAAARGAQRNRDFGFHVVEKADIMRIGGHIARPVGPIIDHDVTRNAAPRTADMSRVFDVDALAPNLVRPALARRKAQNQFARSHIDQGQKPARAADGERGFFERGLENFVGLGQRGLRQIDGKLVGMKRSDRQNRVGQSASCGRSGRSGKRWKHGN